LRATGHHHHLLCERCHRVVEIDDCDLAGWVDAVAQRDGFVANDHRVEISGLCDECRGDGAPPSASMSDCRASP
jgi:Fur family transcriptional regulator, ferric uptake regulator